MKDSEMDGDVAHFCTDNQCVSLHPRGMDSVSETPIVPRMRRYIQVTLAFMVITVASSLLALFMVVLQSPSRILDKDPSSREFSALLLGDNTTGHLPAEPNNHPPRSEMQGIVQMFKDHMGSSRSWHMEIQMLKCKVDNVSSQIQALGGHLEDTSADIEMAKGALRDTSALSLQTQALRSSLEVANAEIQRLRGDMEKANAITSQTQSLLNSSTENTRAELYALGRGLKGAGTELKTLKAGLEMASLQAWLANSTLESANAEIHSLRERLESVDDLRAQEQVLRSGLEGAQAEIQMLKGSLQSTHALSSQIQILLQGNVDNTSAEIGALRGHLERAGHEMHSLKKDLEAVTAQTQRTSGHLKQTDTKIQELKFEVENANSVNSKIQVVNGQLENTHRELQTLKGGMEDVAALKSETQAMQANLQRTRAEVQKLKEDLEATKVLSAKIQEEQTHLKTMQESLALQEQLQRTQSQLLQLILQGWKVFMGSLYYFSHVKKSWHEAEQFCVSQGAHLASVTSQEEQAGSTYSLNSYEHLILEVEVNERDTLGPGKAFLVQSTSTSYHWIGLTDSGTEAAWRWVDGTPFNHAQSKQFWDKNQPDNWQHRNGEFEDCVHIQRMWNDMNCKASYHWVCKKPMGQTVA